MEEKKMLLKLVMIILVLCTSAAVFAPVSASKERPTASQTPVSGKRYSRNQHPDFLDPLRELQLTMPDPLIIMFEGYHGCNPYNDFSGWIADLQAQGYSIMVNTAPISLSVLQQADILVVPGADANYRITSPYTSSEASIIAQFVNLGGGLFLTTDWDVFSDDTEAIASAFGITIDGSSGGWVVFTTFDTTHPIMQGISSVKFFMYTTITPGPSSALIWQTDLEPVAVTLKHGSGKVAVFGDYNFVDTPYVNGYNTLDNAKLAMQTIKWLAPTPKKISVTVDKPYPQYYRYGQTMKVNITFENPHLEPNAVIFVWYAWVLYPKQMWILIMATPYTMPSGATLFTFTFNCNWGFSMVTAWFVGILDQTTYDIISYSYALWAYTP